MMRDPYALAEGGLLRGETQACRGLDGSGADTGDQRVGEARDAVERAMVDRSARRGGGAAVSLKGCHAYFIGIGGCGMSGLAQLFATRGAFVRGSDSTRTATTDALQAADITVTFDQARDPVPDGCDLVVASAAIKPDHPQIADARRRGIRVMLYADALGACMEGSTGIAVAGTHGKSTTTAMLGVALADAGLSPSVIVGATSRQLTHGALGPLAGTTGFRLGSPEIPAGRRSGAAGFEDYRAGLLVAEACEYNRSFHSLSPTIACVTSVEADHLDVYKDMDEIIEAFRVFASMLPPKEQGGRLLIAHEGANRREVASGASCLVETIGFNPEADWVVSYASLSREVTVRRAAPGADHGRAWTWHNTVAGAHNATNAATAFVLARYVGADAERVCASLARFTGVDRRMQVIGERAVNAGRSEPHGFVRVYDDYGHHPTEVDVTLRALREAERPESRGGRLICVFQPHQHSRTRHLLEEFAASFSHADVVIVPEIYFVRDSEDERHKVTSGDLVDRLRARGTRAMHLHPFDAIVEQLEVMCRPGDVVVTMGAGDVHKIGSAFVARGREGAHDATTTEARL